MNLEKKLSFITARLFRNPKTTGIITFFIVLLIGSLFIYLRHHLLREEQRNEMAIHLDEVKKNVDQSLKSCYTSALTLALTVDAQGQPRNFDTVAARIIEANSHLKAVQLVPNGVVKYMYPLKGNENVINLDVFKYSSEVAAEAKATLKARKMYFAGPITLVQGYLGIIGRMPLFINNKFWGFAAVIIKFDDFLRQTGIYNKKGNKFLIQLSKMHPVSRKERFFLSVDKDFSASEFETIDFPDGDWKIYMVAADPYATYLPLILPAVFFILSAGGLGLLVYVLLKKPSELQLLIYQQASELLQNEIKFKTIFEQAAIGIIEVNAETGEFVQANEKFCKIVGYSVNELEEIALQSITHPDDRLTDEAYFNMLQRGEIQEYTKVKRYMHRDGHVVWVNLAVSPLWNVETGRRSNIGVVEDITERNATERKAREYQYRVESLINTIDGIVWESDPQTFESTFVSKKVESILGYTTDEWLSSNTFWEDHLHPDDRDWAVSYSMTNTRQLKQHDLEYRMIAKSGRTVWLRDIVNVIVDHDKPVMLRGIMIDISKHKKAEQDLSDSFDLVNEQNKRLLNFSYIVSHNLRSHTSNIQSISTLIETADSDEERNEMIELLKTVSQALNETLLNLNKVVNIQTNINIVKESLCLSDYVSRTLDILHDQIILKDAQIVNYIDEHVTVYYNPAYLESILLNFIYNAIRYSHSDRRPFIEISYGKEDLLYVEIKDNGIGMDLERHGQELFGMYKTFTGNPDGRGVGLFISKNQIEAMGGRVTVDSKVGDGTSFRIYFR
ncbi:histidine kinase sensor protein [Pedobacter sp. BAL39]|uniref:sensor histidine kinase n=1 Tax=Pedobacter sp. BAL39 TaxID=391596 RepID=UPI00015591DF|nr:PAS domain S-box protein [Pedobacter sp. BAL39]EDM36841.1 histidine kinase sensor protein [Pedobacter sp. BAL39]